MTKITYIPGEIANAAIDEHGNRKPVTRTQHIFDDTLEKPQSEVNQDRIEDIAAETQRAQQAEGVLDGKISLEKQRAEGVESGLNNRLGTVEQLAEISIGGGDAQIATGADFTNPDATKRAKVPTVGAIVDGLNDGVYDVSKRNPSGAPNSDGKFTLEYILSNADTLIPISWRHGGMLISFVDSSDNNYVQARCMAQNFTTDTTQWAIAEEGVYVDNPEFVYVKTDKDGKILWAIKTDGGIYYGAGVPQQVIDYVEEKIADLSLDEYEDIVAFLSGLEEGDKTLQTLLNEKVDKEESKSLIDAEYASSQSAIDNPEFLEVTTDSEDKVLEGIQQDGTKVITGDIKILGNMEVSGVSYRVIENSEYIAAWVDAEDKVIFGFKTDGKTYVGDADFLNDIEEIKAFLTGIAANIDWNAISSITEIENPEYIEAKTDLEGKILAGRTPDGAAFENVGFSTPNISIDGYTIENIEDLEGRREVTLDSEGKIISYRDNNGTQHENVGFETKVIKSESYDFSEENANELKEALDSIGYISKTPNDLTEQSSIQIEEPRLAIINITNETNSAVWPPRKKSDFHYWMHFYDGNGNYFKKRIIMNAQGNSSLAFPKKNSTIDICNDEWEGDDTCPIRFGNWTPCDSFHLKAYYFDFFKGIGMIACKTYNMVSETRTFVSDRPWKKALLSEDDLDDTKVGNPEYDTLSNLNIQIDNGARCISYGFPVLVFLNDNFYGIYALTYKKHRSNYNLDGDTTSNIHLDGDLAYSDIFGGVVRWNRFEIRNPKNLVCASAYSEYNPTVSSEVKAAFKYDADIAQVEIAGTDSAAPYSDGSTYNIGDYTLYDNRLFMAIAQTSGHTPTPCTKPKDVYKKAAENGYWIDVTYTNEVKQYIINLSGRMSQIENAQDQREEFEKYFDIDNIVDYELMICYLQNTDGQGTNWQFVTYDGVKWYICPWDLERILGQSFTFNTLKPAPVNANLGLSSYITGTPNDWVNNNCHSELKQRWQYLVEQKIFNADTFVKTLKDWTDRIGIDYFKKEYEDVWKDSPCCRNSMLNKEYWEFTYDYNNSSEWDENTTYTIGRIVQYKVRHDGYM